MAGGTLLVDTSFLGDVVCAEPLVRAAARRFGPPVDFLTAPAAAEILAGHPDLREVLVFDKRGAERGLRGLWRAARRLRGRRYERAISSHRSFRTALLLWLARVPERVGFHDAAAARLYTRRVRHRACAHEIERNLDLAGGGGWERPRMHLGALERARAAALAPPPPFVALAPGSIWATKRWPAESWAALLRALASDGVACVLIGSAADAALCREVVGQARLDPSAGARVRDLCGQASLRESYAVLERAAALVTNDSAPMHLGVAAGIPVVALYCSTVPEFGFAPRGERDAVLQVGGLPCRPCGVHGRRRCPAGHFRCGRDLAAGAVLAAVRGRLPAGG